MNALTDKLIAIANKQLGVHEQGGNNCGPMIAEYQKATWLPVGAWPWCAAFICWIIREWLQDPEVQAYFKISAKEVEVWRPHGANVDDFIKWGKTRGFSILGPSEPARGGDIVIFDFGHVGMVTTDAAPSESAIATIEGNTNAAGQRDSHTGDSVMHKTRSISIVRVYIRMMHEELIAV